MNLPLETKLKELTLSRSGLRRVLQNHEYRCGEEDFDDFRRSFTPGEWVAIHRDNSLWQLGFVNLGAKNPRSVVHLLGEPSWRVHPTWADGIEYLQTKIWAALNYRRLFMPHNFSYCRLIYGRMDGLPGLVVDRYGEIVLVQITLAGLDICRDQITAMLKAELGDVRVYLSDKASSRAAEALPQFESTYDFSAISIVENGLQFSLPQSLLQKNGYYYDHRRNRALLAEFVTGRTDIQRGLDLFCYIGGWGLNLAKAGVGQIDFVDQGDFAEVITHNAMLNQMAPERCPFVRQDAFRFLEACQHRGPCYDVIVSDPPAFAKMAQKSEEAIRGYKRLAELTLPLLRADGLLAFCSCTHYVDHQRFEDIVVQAALKRGRHVRLLATGNQDIDHPFVHSRSDENYIKCFIYSVT